MMFTTLHEVGGQLSYGKWLTVISPFYMDCSEVAPSPERPVTAQFKCCIFN